MDTWGRTLYLEMNSGYLVMDSEYLNKDSGYLEMDSRYIEIHSGYFEMDFRDALVSFYTTRDGVDYRRLKMDSTPMGLVLDK